MLETIAIILLVLWLLGVVSGYTRELHLRPAGHRDHPLPREAGLGPARGVASADIRSTFSAPDYRGAREHDGARHGNSCAERLAEHDRPEEDGDHRIDVRVERDRRERQVLERMRACAENPTIDPMNSK